MIAYMIVAVFILAAADGAVVKTEPLENKTGNVGGTIQKYTDEAKEWLNMEFNDTQQLAKQEMNETQQLVNQEMNETSAIFQEEVKDAELWVRSLKNISEEWTDDKFNEIVDFTQQLLPNASADGCLCHQKTCGCCLHAAEPEIHLNSTVCINVTYLSEEYGISFVLTLNNITLYNETVSVHNPPPVCVGFPYVKKLADVCVRLYDIDTSGHTFHACARLEARMKLVLVAHIDLGCFTIGKSGFGPDDYFQPSVLMI